MTEDEKQFLMDLFDRHELSLDIIMCLLGAAAAHMSAVATEAGNESLLHAMFDLDFDCMKYLSGYKEK